MQTCVAWRYRLHRQVVPRRNPESMPKHISRQAVFGKFLETRNLTDSRGSWLIILYVSNNSCLIIKITRKAPLTWFPLLKMDFCEFFLIINDLTWLYLILAHCLTQSSLSVHLVVVFQLPLAAHCQLGFLYPFTFMPKLNLAKRKLICIYQGSNP